MLKSFDCVTERRKNLNPPAWRIPGPPLTHFIFVYWWLTDQKSDLFFFQTSMHMWCCHFFHKIIVLILRIAAHLENKIVYGKHPHILFLLLPLLAQHSRLIVHCWMAGMLRNFWTGEQEGRVNCWAVLFLLVQHYWTIRNFRREGMGTRQR